MHSTTDQVTGRRLSVLHTAGRFVVPVVECCLQSKLRTHSSCCSLRFLLSTARVWVFLLARCIALVETLGKSLSPLRAQALARELVGIVENVSPRYGLRRGDGKEATMKLAREIRRIEPFLKLLTRREFGFADCLPTEESARSFLLESLLRERLAIGDQLASEEELLVQIQGRLRI